tara:strand:- start:263 stop:922 length:660 start_codon:yes stop_codon:yes gene_type:complete
MLINLIEFRNEYCILDYSLAKENLELIGINHWLNKLYKEYNIGKFKKIFGSDCFSKHIKFVEINKIPDINLKSQNIIIDWIDICGYNEDGYIVEPEGNNSFFILSIRGELIFDIPQKVLIEWSDIKKIQHIAKNEALKFNRDKFYSWHHKERIHNDGSVSCEGGDDIWRMLDYWLAIKTDDPKIDCFSAWDGDIDDFKYEILEENIEDAIASLNSKNLD